MTMGEVVKQNWPTKLAMPVEKVLQGAVDADLDGVVVIGFRKDGGWYFTSSEPDSGYNIYHCTKAIYELHKTEDRLSGEPA